MDLTRRAFTASVLAAWPAATLPAPQADDPAGRIWSPDTIRWQPDDLPGAKYAVLDGDRDRPDALFTYAFWLPGGVWAPVHRHSQAAHVAVMQGALRIGFGTVADRSNTRTLRAGDFFVVRAGEAHFEGSDEPCLIIGTARGGWTTTTLG